MTTTTATTLQHATTTTTLHYITTTTTTTPQHATTTTTTPITSNYTNCNYNSTAQQLQLQRTTLHPAVVGEVTTATTCNHSKKHNFKHLSVHQWIRSAVRGSQQPTSYRFPIFETSATALCGTTGIIYLSI